MSFSEYLTNESQKQHINLSAAAWNTIEDDICSFYPQESRDRNYSNFFNRIFLSWIGTSPANLSVRLENKKKEYRRLLNEKPFIYMKEEEREDLFLRLCDIYLEEISEELLCFPKGDGRKIHLNNNTCEHILRFSDDSPECRIYKKPGTYLKAVFETYCRLPYIERERIFFSDTFERIHNALDLDLMMQIRTTADKSFSFLPFGTGTDANSNYHYLIGLSRPLSPSGPDTAAAEEYRCSSFRISRIKSIQNEYGKKAKLTQQQRGFIEKEIAEKGIPFLLNDAAEIRVRLSEEGVKKYNTLLHLRPKYTSKTDDGIYTFHITPMQAEFYFFKFGDDAEILHPADLREKFRRKYEEAFRRYADRAPEEEENRDIGKYGTREIEKCNVIRHMLQK